MSAKLTDPKVNGRYPFTYKRAVETDVAATFRRIRAERREAALPDAKVTQLRKGK